MTIREAQELVRFTDEKSGRAAETTLMNENEAAVRFRELLREANNAGIDLTKALVESPGDKK